MQCVPKSWDAAHKSACATLRRADLAQDAVVDPVLVPPFDGIRLYAVDLHAEVQVVAARESGGAAQTHDLAFLDHVAGLHIDLIQVAVEGLQTKPVIHDDAVAIDA